MANRTAQQEITEAALPDPEELVTYTAPLLGSDARSDIVCAVNGETIRIQRGYPVQIKRKFVEVLEHSAEQERRAWDNIRAAQRRGARPMMEFR